MPQRVFDTGGALEFGELLERLTGCARFEPLRGRAWHVTYYDTFDWRLHAAGVQLSRIRDGDGDDRLRLDTPDRSIERPYPAGTEIGFAREFADRKLRRTLEPIARIRRLLPLVEAEIREQQANVLDGEDGSPARIALVRGSARVPESPEKVPLPDVCVIESDAEPEAALEAVVNVLSAELELLERAPHLGVTAAESVGLAPGGYSSKQRIVLDESMAAAEAARVIHSGLLDTILTNEPGVRANLDSEFLHDFRVSVRRARSALALLKGVFPRPVAKGLKSELKWLQGLTGPLRDLDVYLLKMDDYRNDLPEDLRDHLDPLETYLNVHHRIEHGRLVEALDSERYQRLLVDWRAFLDRPREDDETCRNADRPVVDVATERIWHAYRRVRRKGDAITDESPDESLHALRIECKKLRYLLEFFTSLFDAEKVSRIVQSLKLLQDNLGDFNDLSVQQEKLTGFAQHMVEEQDVGADSLLAMGRLVEHLAARQDKERHRFRRRYAKFASAGTHRRFRRLFH